MDMPEALSSDGRQLIIIQQYHTNQDCVFKYLAANKLLSGLIARYLCYIEKVQIRQSQKFLKDSDFNFPVRTKRN